MGLGTQVTSGNKGSNSSWQMAMINLLRRLVGLHDKDDVQVIVDGITDTTAHAVMPAVVGKRNTIVDFLVTNGHTTNGTFVEFRENTTSGTLLWKGYAKAESGWVQGMRIPVLASKGAAIIVRCTVGTTNTTVCVKGRVED
jgi:hypothetical protein